MSALDRYVVNAYSRVAHSRRVTCSKVPHVRLRRRPQDGAETNTGDRMGGAPHLYDFLVQGQAKDMPTVLRISLLPTTMETAQFFQIL